MEVHYRINKGFVLAVSAPSGTGKTSLCDKLADELPYVIRSISATTRPQRDGEIAGQDYEFLAPEDFKNKREQGYFLETAEVFGHWYGTPRRPVEDSIAAGKVIVMDIDTLGAFEIQRGLPKDTVLLFILPPSLGELENRLKARGKNSPEELKRRLGEAAREISEAHRYDYIIKNDRFDEAYSQLKSVVLAEHMRAYRLDKVL